MTVRSRSHPLRLTAVAAAAGCVLLLTACNPTAPTQATIRGFYAGGDGGHVYTPTASGIVQVDVTNSNCWAVFALQSVNGPNPFGYPELWGADDSVARGWINVRYATAGQPFQFYMYNSDRDSVCWADYQVRVVDGYPGATHVVGDLT